jgi:ADP-ribose pyrophosphatase YjhB (NUDIX family)
MKQTTLGIIIQNGKILLGMKKRRFGEWKWNGPGGKVDIGETIEECMQRETFEEFGISINTQTMKKVWVFDWINKANEDQNHIVNIFLITEFTGTPVETEEMKPEWFSLDTIPYHQMWEDDKTWLPRVLNGEYIEYEFIYWVDGKIESLTLKK